MKVFTLGIANNREVHLSGDLSLPEAKQIIDAILQQQAFNQGQQAEKQKIRQGYKRIRRK